MKGEKRGDSIGRNEREKVGKENGGLVRGNKRREATPGSLETK